MRPRRNRKSAAERQRRHRNRRALGLRVVSVEIPDEVVNAFVMNVLWKGCDISELEIVGAVVSCILEQ